MGQVVSSTVGIADTGIGPVSVTVSIMNNFDIDDFVHSVVRAQCIQLQLINAIQTADPSLATNRPPLNINGNVIGGY
jgi:hypothetical protein